MLHQLITDNIDLWTSAEKKRSTAGRGSNGKTELTGIKKLRELILELAVRGLLVPQDPNNEPASVLLAKIATEKEALFKAGKIKKQKPSPEITEDEKPFALPDHWEWTRLQQISEYIQRGKGPKYAEQGTVRVVSQKCVQWSGFDLSKARYVDDSSLDNYQEERFLKTNDLLWNSTGTGTVGRINVISTIDGSLVADSHVTVVRLLGVNSPFVGCFLTSPRIQLRIEPDHENALVSGTTNQVELNTSAVNPILIPLPPLDEQQRIVAKVDELMALCDQLEQQHIQHSDTHHTLVTTLLDSLSQATEPTRFQAIWSQLAANFDTLFTSEASIDQLKQTILQLAVMGSFNPSSKDKKKVDDAFFDIEVPNNWRIARLADVSESTQGIQISKAYQISERAEGYRRYLYISDFGDSYTLKYIEDIYARKIVTIKDLVMANTGATCGTVYKGIDGILSNNLFKISFDENLFFNDFLFFYLKSKWFVDGIKRYVKGGANPHMGHKAFGTQYVFIPPLPEQHHIVAKVDELMALCDQLKARLNQAQTTQQQLAYAIVEQAIN